MLFRQSWARRELGKFCLQVLGFVQVSTWKPDGNINFWQQLPVYPWMPSWESRGGEGRRAMSLPLSLPCLISSAVRSINTYRDHTTQVTAMTWNVTEQNIFLLSLVVIWSFSHCKQKRSTHHHVYNQTILLSVNVPDRNLQCKVNIMFSIWHHTSIFT